MISMIFTVATTKPILLGRVVYLTYIPQLILVTNLLQENWFMHFNITDMNNQKKQKVHTVPSS